MMTYKVRIPVNLVARVVHEANRVIQDATGDPAVSPPYDEAPQWQKDSTFLGIHEAFNGKTPEELHETWSAQKIADGWIYGEVKDAEKKTHPCLVTHSELPDEQKLKDYLFHAIVKAFKDAPEVDC